MIDKTNSYDLVYDWFDTLKTNSHFINGYVIIPNHIHALISFINARQKINTIIDNGKRFMAYEIVERLKNNNEILILDKLTGNIEPTRKLNNKLHELWQPSFDWKDCRTNKFIYQKLD